MRCDRKKRTKEAEKTGACALRNAQGAIKQNDKENDDGGKSDYIQLYIKVRVKLPY